MNVIDFGGSVPVRKHEGDAGADVFSTKSYLLSPGQTVCIPLGIGVEIPKGMVGFILPRSSMAKRGVVSQAVPIDSNYRGEIHAIVTNYNRWHEEIKAGDRIAQLVVFPCSMDEMTLIKPSEASETDRGAGAFGSTGR
jgi:dUTP pyrophosphatase